MKALLVCGHTVTDKRYTGYCETCKHERGDCQAKGGLFCTPVEEICGGGVVNETNIHFLPQCPYCYEPTAPGEVCNCEESRNVFNKTISKAYNPAQRKFILSQKHIYWLTEEIVIWTDKSLSKEELEEMQKHSDEVLKIARNKMVKYEA